MKTKLLALSILISTLGYSQWTNNYQENTIVANSFTRDVETIGTNDGKTYVIYWDESTGANNYILKVQLLDENGNRLFGEEGMILNNTAPMESYTMTRDQVVDNEGNLYVSFTASGNGKGYVHKISPTGIQIYGTTGIDLGENGFGTKLAPTPEGGVIVSWENKIMKYSANGIPIWSEPKEIIHTGGNTNIFVGEVILLSDNSFVVVYHVSETSWTLDSNLWANKYDADGSMVWASSTQLSDKTTRSNGRHDFVKDNQDNIYYSYYGGTEWRSDSFIQKIKPDGTTPWGINGTDFSTNDEFYEYQTSVALDESSPYIWANAIVSSPSQNQNGQFVQKINKETGERLLGDSGKEVFPVSENNWIAVSKVQLVNKKPYFLFSNNISDGVNQIQLGVTLLDENGNFAWQDQYKLIAATDHNKGNYGFTKNVNGQSVAVWTEDRGQGERAYAQNIKPEDFLSTGSSIKNKFSVYPNPVVDYLNIKSNIDAQSVNVYNLAGQNVLNSKLNNGKVELSSLTKGIYLIQVNFKDGKKESFKLIKK